MKVISVLPIFTTVVFLSLTLVSSIDFEYRQWNKPKHETLNLSENKMVGIICYEPDSEKPSLQNLWKSVHFGFNSADNGLKVLEGNDKNEVIQRYENQSLLDWSKSIIYSRVQSLTILPFKKTCVLIKSSQPVDVNLHSESFDVWIFFRLILGILLFHLAAKLSRNIFFHYGAGISFGVLASVLIGIFVLSRIIPKKSFSVVFLLGGFSTTVFFVQRFCTQLQQLAFSYLEFVAAYFVAIGVLSFAVCYYKGPVCNPRLLDLIKWLMQLIGLFLIYSGTQISEVSATFILIVIICHFIPSFGFGKAFMKYWHRKFPPKIKLLTEEEYIQQGIIETEKALNELRAFCSSPDCNAWKTLSRLSSPSRFAKWVEGDSDHIEETEYLEHESPHPVQFPDLSEDDDDDAWNSSQHQGSFQRDAWNSSQHRGSFR